VQGSKGESGNRGIGESERRRRGAEPRAVSRDGAEKRGAQCGLRNAEWAGRTVSRMEIGRRGDGETGGGRQKAGGSLELRSRGASGNRRQGDGETRGHGDTGNGRNRESARRRARDKGRRQRAEGRRQQTGKRRGGDGEQRRAAARFTLSAVSLEYPEEAELSYLTLYIIMLSHALPPSRAGAVRCLGREELSCRRAHRTAPRG